MSFELIQHSFNEKKITKSEYYNLLTVEVMRRFLSPNSVCLDIGCHSGEILSKMMHFASNGNFLAFEPLPYFYQHLKKKFRNPRVQIFELALSNVEESAKFNYVKSNPAYSGLQKRKYPRETEVIEEIMVQTTTLDLVVKREGLQRIDFIKIDVEGAERLVFDGGKNSIAAFAPLIAFEYGRGAANYYGTTPEGIYDLICNECRLRISLLPNFLQKKEPFSRSEFVNHYSTGRDFFYLAHPFPLPFF